MKVETGTVTMTATIGILKAGKTYPTKLWIDEADRQVGWEITSTRPLKDKDQGGGTPAPRGGRGVDK